MIVLVINNMLNIIMVRTQYLSNVRMKDMQNMNLKQYTNNKYGILHKN